MKNIAIKNFDTQLGNLINNALAEGLDISTVVLALDKYLFSAKEVERNVLEQEQNYLANVTNTEVPQENAALEEELIETSEIENGEMV